MNRSEFTQLLEVMDVPNPVGTIGKGVQTALKTGARVAKVMKRKVSRTAGKIKDSVSATVGNAAGKVGDYLDITDKGFKAGVGVGSLYGTKKVYDMSMAESERGEEIEMSKKEFGKEHRRLFKVLKKCKDKKCKSELKRQKKEYRDEMKESAFTMDMVISLIESAPVRVSKAPDAFGRPMIGKLRSSAPSSMKTAGTSFAREAKKLRKVQVAPNA